MLEATLVGFVVLFYIIATIGTLYADYEQGYKSVGRIIKSAAWAFVPTLLLAATIAVSWCILTDPNTGRLLIWAPAVVAGVGLITGAVVAWMAWDDYMGRRFAAFAGLMAAVIGSSFTTTAVLFAILFADMYQWK